MLSQNGSGGRDSRARLLALANPYKRLRAFGNGIRKALLERDLLEERRCRVEAEQTSAGRHSIALKTDSGRDKALYAACVKEFFGPVDNQRYLLVKEGRIKALANREERCYSHKKVKGALE